MAIGPRVGPGRRQRRRRDPDATAYIAAMSVAPNATVEAAIRDLIRKMKADGRYATLNLGYLENLHTEQASRLNMKAPGTFTLTDVGAAPTWATGVGGAGGFTAAATANGNQITTGWDPVNNGGGIFLQDSCGVTLGSGSSGAVSASFPDIGQAPRFNLRLRTSSPVDTWQSRMSSTVTVNGTAGLVPDGSGVFTWVRTGAAGYSVRRNGVLVEAVSDASFALDSNDMYVCGVNGSNSSARRQKYAFFHAGWSDAQIDNHHADLIAFDTAIGAT